MNILILANNDVGLYQFRKELIQELLKENTVKISLPYGHLVDKLKEFGCDFIESSVDRRGINPIKDIKLLLSYLKIVKRSNPDLVITYTIKPNVYGGLVCRLLKKQYAVNITGLGTAFQGNGILRKVVVLLYKASLKKAKTVFFENAENMQIFLDEKICKKSQVCLLNGAGVNLEHFTPKEYPTQDSRIRFLFIGRVMKEKGIDELFEAMTRLRQDNIDCALDVVGSFEEDYEQKINQFTNEGWLRFHGYQTDVRPFLANSHCFVLPSYHEGMANTNLEAASSARPIITSNIHGCKEAVIDGVTGFLCESKNADSLYESMKKFINLPYDKKITLGLNGRKHMEDNFDKKRVVKETIKVLINY